MMNLHEHATLTHARAWVCPEGQVIECGRSAATIEHLLQHHPHLRGHHEQLTTTQFLNMVYQAGYTQIGCYRDQVLFEHGLNQRPDPQQMDQLCGHLTYRGTRVTCATSLFQRATGVRRRFFSDR